MRSREEARGALGAAETGGLTAKRGAAGPRDAEAEGASGGVDRTEGSGGGRTGDGWAQAGGGARGR